MSDPLSASERPAPLSELQVAILRRIAEDRTAVCAAAEVGLSVSELAHELAVVRGLLGVGSTAQALAAAEAAGLLA